MDGRSPNDPGNRPRSARSSAHIADRLSRPAAPTYYPQLQAQDSMLREYLRVLIKRKWVVISSVLIIFGVVATATMRTTRIYEAAGSIAINKTDPALLNLKDSANGAIDYDPSDLDTEVS